MMSTYLGEDADALDGFEFLTMAEAGEVGHWAVVHGLSRRGGQESVLELAEWAQPIQQRHLDQVLQGSVKLAEGAGPERDRLDK